MAVSGQELASLDFANLIGGPLNAVVEAQAKSAITTANFIKEVGFDDQGKVKNLDFSYTKTNADGRKQDFSLTVPLLAMLPIPYIKIKQADIRFNAKITSTTEATSSSVTTANVTVKARGRWWFSKARVASRSSYQKNTASSDSEQRSFEMNVHVRAKGADMPEGTARILNMLQNCIGEEAGDVAPMEVFVTRQIGSTNEYRIESAEFGNLLDLLESEPKPTLKISATSSGVASGIEVLSASRNKKTITLNAGLVGETITDTTFYVDEVDV